MILKLKNISHGFSPSSKVLDNVSLELEKGKIYALLGANGSGKTTLFNIITGFITPQSGEIYFNSKRLIRMLPHQINSLGIGRTFQDLRLISKLTVKENVILAMNDNPTQSWYKGLLPKSVYRKKLESLSKRADEIIDSCFLSGVSDSVANEISYGQQKLLNLACCIANDAELFLLDEPVAGISPANRKEIAKSITALRNQGKTILFIEHNREFVDEIAQRQFLLKNGSIENALKDELITK